MFDKQNKISYSFPKMGNKKMSTDHDNIVICCLKSIKLKQNAFFLELK